MLRRALTRRVLLRALLALAAIVVILNWTYGRLPATPRASGSFVQLAGIKLRYLERPGAEPAVLLIHGLPGTAEDFSDVTPLLAGRRTVAIDRPGYGFSTGGYYPFARQLQAVQEVIDKLHLGRVILVGHSYGGAISLGFAERHPGEVRGLVLADAAGASCPRPGSFERLQAHTIKVLELPVIAQIADVTFSQLLRKVSAEQGDSEAFDPATVAPAHLHRVLAVNMKHGNLEALAGERLAAGGVVEAVGRGLHAVKVPAVVIQGEHDKLVEPACGRRLAAMLPDARLEMVSGGHMASYTHPQVVATAVESLAGSPPRLAPRRRPGR